jgi:hypothetical protein
MANLENNNSENNKPISEKVGEKTDVAEGVKHTIEHPVELPRNCSSGCRRCTKVFLVVKLFLWFAAIASFYFLLFNHYQSSCKRIMQQVEL